MTESHQEKECADVVRAMYFFLDQEELSSEQRAHVQQHLDECNPCLEAFEFEHELRDVVRRRCAEHLPPGVRERIRAKILNELH